MAALHGEQGCRSSLLDHTPYFLRCSTAVAICSQTLTSYFDFLKSHIFYYIGRVLCFVVFSVNQNRKNSLCYITAQLHMIELCSRAIHENKNCSVIVTVTQLGVLLSANNLPRFYYPTSYWDCKNMPQWYSFLNLKIKSN